MRKIPALLLLLAVASCTSTPQTPKPATSAAPGASASSLPLTDAERAVLELLRRGLSNDEIARRRGRSTNTIKTQAAAIVRKTSGSSRRAVALTSDA